MADVHTPVRSAMNCAHWQDGECQVCGVPWQSFEVHAEFSCPNFVERAKASSKGPAHG